MSPVWQNLIVALAVAASLAYFALRAWRSVAGRKSKACNGCRTCEQASSASSTQTLVSLNPGQRR